MKKWIIQREIKKEVLPLIDQILEVLFTNRGITEDKSRTSFLNPSLKDFTLDSVGIDKNEVNKAISRIQKAITNQESVVVYTDYDVDGISSGAIVWETLYTLGAKVLPYVPNRIEEGYGLSQKGIEKIKKDHQVNLIITVDHGISAYDKVLYAKQLGIDCIILDHHVKPKKLPDCEAIVHTTTLSAAGIAWIFSDYLLTFFKKNNAVVQMENFALSVLGTIGDLMILKGANRIIAKYGLEQLRKTKRIGLVALYKICTLVQDEIDTYHISHVLAPRINAMGRITSAIDALRLLCTKDQQRATQLASLLHSTNRDRQTLTESSLVHAFDQVKLEMKNNGGVGNLLIVSDESYHQGIIGLIAGKLTEKYFRPSIALSVGEKISKASARSIPGFNIVETIRQANDILLDVGGHPMAAGFTIETKNLHKLKTRLIEIAKKEITEELLVKTLSIDMCLNFENISTQLYLKISDLKPFGVGNPEPVFATLAVEVLGASPIGRDGKHLRMLLREKNKPTQLEAIGFGMGQFYSELSKDSIVDVAYTIDLNKWNGREKLQLKLKDVRIAQIK